jgi:hypothetical protein
MKRDLWSAAAMPPLIDDSGGTAAALQIRGLAG